MKGSPRMVWAAAIIVAVVLLAGDGQAQSPTRRGAEEWPEAGFFAPDFALPDFNGKQVKLSDFRGTKAVFLNFWASWCPSCQEEMPTMEKLYQRFRARGLEIIAVSIDKNQRDAARFVTKHGLTFPILLDLNFKVAGEYRVTGIPTHYFIDRAGVIKSREVGSKDWGKPETWKAIEGLLGR